MAEPTGPDRSEIRVTDIEDPLPDATFGSIGRYVEVTRADGGEGPFVPQPLVLGFDEHQAEHVDPYSLTIFEVDVEPRRFTLLESSQVDVDGREVWGWVDHPGVYGAIGLPSHPAVLETLRLFHRFRPQLVEEAARGERGFQDRICGLILCENPTTLGGGPLGPGDLCELCLGLDISFGRLPELFLLEPQLPLRPLPPKHSKPPKPALPKILAWGYNGHGMLGDGTYTDRATPVWVPGFEAAKIGGGGYMTIALATDGRVWAWGANFLGELGGGSTGSGRPTPGLVSGLTNAVDVAGGYEHGLAVRADGSVWFWGRSHTGGAQPLPAKVAGLSNAVAAAAGTDFNLVLTADGRVWSWGDNRYGMLGDGSTSSRSTPALVPGLTQVRSIAAGLYSGFAVRTDGTVRAWGSNGRGVLGDGTETSRHSPVTVSGLTNVEEVSAGWHGLARTSAGQMWAWGAGGLGAIGDGAGADRLSPVQVPGLASITDAAAGGSHSLARDSGGTVWAWGVGNYGQIGDGASTGRLSPVTVPLPAGPTLARAVGAGIESSFAVVQ